MVTMCVRRWVAVVMLLCLQSAVSAMRMYAVRSAVVGVASQMTAPSMRSHGAAMRCWPRRRMGVTRLLCVAAQPSPASSSPASSITTSTSPLAAKTWNLSNLRKDVAKQYMRWFKKASSAQERMRKLQGRTITANSSGVNPPSLAEAVEQAENDVEVCARHLQSIREIEAVLSTVLSVKEDAFLELVPKLVALDITDLPPAKKPRPPANSGSPKAEAGPRMPYWRYQSVDGLEIRVGRSAVDNDLLSCDKQHRDANDWWMHVSGHAGSHVVIRYTKDDLPGTFPESVIDAALLTAMHSKCSQAGKVVVSMTRCKSVSKPKDAKAGLVMLSGVVKHVKIDLHAEKTRLDRLKRI